jgi:hypothetical protein
MGHAVRRNLWNEPRGRLAQRWGERWRAKIQQGTKSIMVFFGTTSALAFVS